MYTKKFLYLVMICCVSLPNWKVAKAQETTVANIKLRNGSRIGQAPILKMNQEELIILSHDSARIRLETNEIRKIKFLNGYRPVDSYDSTHYYGQATLSWYRSIHLGIAYGDETINLSAGHIHGIKFHRFWGGGIGINYDEYKNASLIPVYIDVRAYLGGEIFQPYYFANLGYGFTVDHNAPDNALNEKSSGGLMWQGGIGFQSNFKNSAIALNLGYKQQKSHLLYEIREPWTGSLTEYEESRINKRFTITFHFLF